MTMPSTRGFAAAVVFVLATVVLGPALHAEPKAAAREPGDLWEVTSQMSMEGMPMAIPARTQRVCSSKEWTEPPAPKDDEHKCRTTDFHTSGSKVSWKMECEGPPAMSGEGEITRNGADAYTGSMKLASPQGAMTMKLSGRRLGDCDAAETKREVAKIQAQAAESQAQGAAIRAETCKTPVASMSLETFRMMASMCDEAAFKTEYCKRLETMEGFELLSPCTEGRENVLKEAAAYCGKDAEKIQQTMCTEALQKESLDLIGRCCPAEAQAIAQRECAGLKYTALTGSKYYPLCVRYAQGLQAGDTAGQAEAAKPETKKEKTKKTLKGLFGR